MNRVKFYFMLILMLPILCVNITGCGMSERNKVTNEKKDEVVETLLNEFFSFNKDERYISFTRLTEKQENSESSRQAYEKSYAALSKLSTQSCFDNLQQNRLPVQYDKYVVDNEIHVQIDEMEYEEVEENVYEFSVTFKSDNEAFSSPMKGKLVTKIIDEEVFIDDIIIY